MEQSKNVSKMSLAASKAWITRRMNAASSKKECKNEKKEKNKKASKAELKMARDIQEKSMSMKADEKREMKALNGTELEQLAKDTQKRMDRKEAFDNAKQGHQDKKAVSVGNIIKKAKIERFNGGVKVSGVQ